jgi:hypothetical protein
MSHSKSVPIAPKAFGLHSATATLAAALDAACLDAVRHHKGRADALIKIADAAKDAARREKIRADGLAADLQTERVRKERELAALQAAYDELAGRLRAAEPGPTGAAGTPSGPDADEIRQLRLDLDTADDLLVGCDAERHAALRARDAVQARLDGYLEADGRATGPVASLRALLDGDTAEGVLELAERYCTLLRITCDRKAVGVLDHGTGAATYRRRLADALATMQAYAEAKTAAYALGSAAGPALANLKSFCTAGDGALISHLAVTLGEGQIVSTSRKMSSQRRLPVPVDVDPSGRAVIEAHIRIGSGKPPAPRLYFGDYLEQHGFLVVGYVGEHLMNLATN